MNWPAAEQISTMWSLPDGYRNVLLTRADVPALIAAIKRWHPDIAVGAASCYLREDFYAEKVCLDGDAKRDVIVVLTKHVMSSPPSARGNENAMH